MKRGLFIDKDGTLVPDLPYNVDPARVSLMPGVGAFLRAMQGEGLCVVVVSNQAGIARGVFGEEQLDGVQARIRELLAEEGVHLDGFYYCPHHPEAAVAEYRRHCLCRKPRPGLLYKAAIELQLDLKASWMVGDILDDVEAGNRAGCMSALFLSGGETKWEFSPIRTPDYMVEEFGRLAEVIGGSGQIGRGNGQRTRSRM